MQVVTPPSDLHEKLLQLGWTLKKIQYKNGVYTAKANNEVTGQEIERAGQSPEMALASVYQYAARAYEVRRYASLKKLAAWTSDWLDQKEEIAKAYSALPPFDEKAVPAWKALAAESRVQADAIRGQITVEISDDPEPYHTAQEMCEDVHKNKHFAVSRANAQHPIWSEEDNVNFRIVHDVLGHCQSGGDFSWRGENLACGVHFALVSPLAREALFTECIAQTAYMSHYRGFGPQKAGLMSEFLHPVQEREGEHIWVPHGGLPQFAQSPNANQGKDMLDQAAGMEGIFNSPGQWVPPQNYVPSPTFEMGTPVMKPFTVQTAKMVSPERPHDPNAFWNPAHQAPPLSDPEQDYIDIGATVENASKIDTEWQTEDEPTQKRAIMNAFRVALLSPRKHLKWNAAHYQAVMHADPATKAVDLWNLLEEARERHNQSLGYPEGSHLAYRKQLEFLAHELQDDGMSSADSLREAKEIIFRKTKEFEAQLAANGSLSELKAYNQARKMVTEWLREHYTPTRGWSPGQLALASKTANSERCPRCNQASLERGLSEVNCVLCGWQAVVEIPAAHLVPPPSAFEHPDPWMDNEPGSLTLPEHWGRTADTLFQTDDDWKSIDSTGFANDEAKYGAFMGAHLDAIEKVGQHIEQIRDAAIEDLEDGGKGFKFRNTVMNMNLSGVNPKVASFAWLLLAPMTSELGIIDAHLLRGLRRTEQQMTPRDYYKLERMQRAGKDATGYSHMPLGLFHWGLWDAIRNPGEHSDHSPLRILDPLPWDSPDARWDAASNARSGPWVGPVQFEDARGHIERAATDFDTEMAGQPQSQVPLATMPHPKKDRHPSPYIVPGVI